MRLRGTFLALTLLLGVAGWATQVGDLAAAGDPHAYFKELLERPDVFKAYSLRPVAGHPITSPYYERQLMRRADQGYAGANSSGLWITYDTASDLDPNRQDAAKVRIPPFMWEGLYGIGRLSANIGPDTVPVTLVGHYGPLYTTVGKSMLIDAEILTVYDPDGSGPIKSFDRDTGVLYAKRGQFGTAAKSHAAGVFVKPSTNSLMNTVRLPLGTLDGHTYFFTWDALWTDSYLGNGLTNHKAFNFISDKVWFEPNASYGGGGITLAKPPGFDRATDVAAFQARTYNMLGGLATWTAEKADYAGPGVTTANPVPQIGTFIIKPNRWVRFFVRIQQRANDYDLVDSWIADELIGPVQIHSRVPLSIRQNSITEFVLEYGTSTEQFTRGHIHDFIGYVRNFVALVDPGDSIANLLRRPEGGAVVAGPAPPRNVRIVN